MVFFQQVPRCGTLDVSPLSLLPYRVLTVSLSSVPCVLSWVCVCRIDWRTSCIRYDEYQAVYLESVDKCYAGFRAKSARYLRMFVVV